MNFLEIIWNVDPEIFRIGSFSLRYYSVLFAFAFLFGYWLMKKMFHKEGLQEHHLMSLFIYILLGTIIGARLGQTLFYEFEYFKNHPLEIILPFRIGEKGLEWTGYQGLASHGGAIGILIALAIYCRKYYYPFLGLADKLAIVVALGGVFIRLGNFFNSEILGKPSTQPWAVVFSRIDIVPRHPAQLYEAVAYLLIFLLLWILYDKLDIRVKKGRLFGLFLSLVFSARFLIEFVKENQKPFEAGWPINMGQLLSVPFILIGIYFCVRMNADAAEKPKPDSQL